MKPEKIFRMEFNPDGSVNLYEEVNKVGGDVVLCLCAMMNGVESAKARARELCPDDMELSILNIQTC